jgi:hypothetical protein
MSQTNAPQLSSYFNVANNHTTGTAPAEIKIFINNPSMGFSDAEDAGP